ncbi:MAG: type II toxin-antitoxin system VapC family toxin [Acidobacteria bacterium]|nr:type II toxin-antitoxin system VapC family toxin [Acidobacteriota bacterium]
MIVADTDVLIDFLRDRAPVADRVALELEQGQLATTVINRFELLAGARGERQRERVLALLEGLVTLPLDADAADQAAEVRRRLEADGEPIGMADSLVAGIVIQRRGILLTRNRRHFDRVAGLALSPLAAS